MAFSIRGGISKVSITIVGLYFFKGYFSIPLVFKQNSFFFPVGIQMHRKASQGIHFSIEALIFTF
jgi:hypothetical protein